MRDVIKQDKLFYTQVVNEIIEDKTISLKAIGLFAFMAHKAQIPGVNWNFTIRSMAKQMKDGEDSIRSGLQELRKVGWVVYTKNTDGTGEYFLKASIKPKQDKPDKALDSQNRENPRRENPKKGNPTPINKNDSLAKNNSSNKELCVVDQFSDEMKSIVQLLIEHRKQNTKSEIKTLRQAEGLIKEINYYANHWKITFNEALDFYLTKTWVSIDCKYEYPFRELAKEELQANKGTAKGLSSINKKRLNYQLNKQKGEYLESN